MGVLSVDRLEQERRHCLRRATNEPWQQSKERKSNDAGSRGNIWGGYRNRIEQQRVSNLL